MCLAGPRSLSFCVCVCVHVRVRARARARKKDRETVLEPRQSVRLEECNDVLGRW